MKKRNNIIFWPPRLFAIFLILLAGLLSTDVFGMGDSFWETVIAFLMHNIPTLFLVIILMISWKWELIGGALWLLGGLGLFSLALGGVHMEGLMLISGVIMMIGLLFALQYFLEKSHKK